jgi:hypothetical protein
MLMSVVGRYLRMLVQSAVFRGLLLEMLSSSRTCQLLLGNCCRNKLMVTASCHVQHTVCAPFGGKASIFLTSISGYFEIIDTKLFSVRYGLKL